MFVNLSTLPPATRDSLARFLRPLKSTRRLARELALENVRDLDFDQATRLLKAKSTREAASACLVRVLHKCDRVVGGEKTELKVGEFLAAYLVIHFPAHIFESVGPKEQAVIASAGSMLRTFEAVCDTDKQLMGSLPALVEAYKCRMFEWQKPDEALLVYRIEMALTALRNAQSLLAPEQHEAIAEFQRHINKLVSRLAALQA